MRKFLLTKMPKEDSEFIRDLESSIWVDFVERISQSGTLDNMKGLLYTIAKRRCSDAYRQRTKDKNLYTDPRCAQFLGHHDK